MNIYVGNLPYSTTEEDLKTAFAPFGQVATVKIVVDRYTARSKGFGFVDMPSDDEAKAAIAGLNGKDMGGRPLKVNESKPRV
jgi:RNA recognition motif-containing protein